MWLAGARVWTIPSGPTAQNARFAIARSPWRGSAFWLLRGLWVRHRGVVVFVQLFSFEILSVVRPGEDLFDLIFPFVLGASALPLYYAVRFLEKDLAFMRNMPLSKGGIGARLLLTQAILFLPEGIMLKNPLWFGLGLAQGMLYTGLLYVDDAGMGRFMRMTLIVVLVTICLLRWNPVMAALIEGGAGAGLFFAYYATYPGAAS